MPKYLVAVSYTAEGARGVAQEGGSGRHAAAQALVESVGGTMESFHFAFGGADVYAIADIPTASDAAALALAVNASGAATLHTTVLLTVEEMDEAAARSAAYRAPGR
jgi:uncharacterized protein with GYD domain